MLDSDQEELKQKPYWHQCLFLDGLPSLVRIVMLDRSITNLFEVKLF